MASSITKQIPKTISQNSEIFGNFDGDRNDDDCNDGDTETQSTVYILYFIMRITSCCTLVKYERSNSR